LISLIEELSANKKTIYALGASTKGNILMNYSGITSNQIPQIGEINSDKWNKFTPGSHIPIVNEEQILSLQPDYLLFLPWHFRDFAVKKYNSYLRNGGKFIFPLPDVEVVSY
jgi:ABC-type Fe3+-hydroxamate transport system substrate-binding protein